MDEGQESQPSSPGEDPKLAEENIEGDPLSLPPLAPSHSQTRARAGSHPIYLGKHRMTAAISNLNNQMKILREELDKVETLGKSSVVCPELISSVESIPDPLLPLTKGPMDVSWDQWFTKAYHSRSHRRWL